MKNYIAYILFAGALAAGFSSCNDFLDENPDNRTTVDSEEKAIDMLVSAYASNQPWFVLELASDNVDDHGGTYGDWSRFYEESFSWNPPVESNNESLIRTWSSQYLAIANANQVLDALGKMEMTDKLRAAKGEALICRAYAHFVLVNIFCQQYDPNYPDDMGIPYMEKAETELDPKYERGTVAEVYAKIEKDIEEGLPLIDDAIYSVPKYHFNRKAAYSFAARFFLYYQKWDKAAEYASEALTNAPESQLRDYEALLEYPMNNGSTQNTAATYYISTDLPCNYLLATAYSSSGTYFGGYSSGRRYNHGWLIGQTESISCTNTPFAPYEWKVRPLVYNSGLDKTLLPHTPYLFEYTDPVAGTGYIHTVYTLFTGDETLLTRAEAYIMQKDYPNALTDMNLFLSNACKSYTPLTEETVTAWAAGTEYYRPETDQNQSDMNKKGPTPKKELHPAFDLDETQEAMVHTLLMLRRYETLHCGLRLFDIKRFGIEIYRRTLDSTDGHVSAVTDKLAVRDNRRAIQLPNDVITSGLPANPR